MNINVSFLKTIQVLDGILQISGTITNTVDKLLFICLLFPSELKVDL